MYTANFTYAEESRVHQVKRRAEYHSRYSRFRKEHPESHGQVENEPEPMNYQEIRLLVAQKRSIEKKLVVPKFSFSFQVYPITPD